MKRRGKLGIGPLWRRIERCSGLAALTAVGMVLIAAPRPATADSPCPPNATGPCCTSGNCTITTQANCSGYWTCHGTCPCYSCCQAGNCTLSASGIPNECTGNQNVGATCNGPNPCVFGSCCINNNCTITNQADCFGVWTSGGVCTPNPCTFPTGSCCAADGGCSITTEGGCPASPSNPNNWTSGGVCSPNPCPQPPGRCCYYGDCTITLHANCAGQWNYGGTCTPNTCPPAGSCCLNGNCIITTQAQCGLGTWTQGGTCNPNLCPQPTGSCCIGVNCTITTQANCTGGWTIGGTCSPNPCLLPAWSLRATTGPSPRNFHAMAYDAARGVTVLFGGNASSPQDDSQTWEWDGTTWTLRFTPFFPGQRYGHAMAYGAAQGGTLLFGGYALDIGGYYSNETWLWDGSGWVAYFFPNNPSGRTWHALAFDAARHVSVLFGGFREPSVGGEGETWEFTSAGEWTLRGDTGFPDFDPGPSARFGHALAYDAARGVTVLFGGYAGQAYDGQTWEWNGGGNGLWTLRANTGPSPRFGLAMAYDAARGQTILFGGSDGSGYNGQTWEWNGVAWALRTTNCPSPRSGHAMAYDSSRHVIVLFGGEDASGLKGDTWEYGIGNAITCCPGDLSADGLLNGLDVQGIAQAIVAPPSPCTAVFCRADVNEDQAVNLLDGYALVTKLLAGEACPPP